MRFKDYPSEESIQTRLDWLEISCLIDEFYYLRFSEFTGMLDTLETFESDDNAEEDASVENELSSLLTEFDRRSHALGNDYPFEIEGDIAIKLKTDDLLQLDPAQFTYLYCLIFSHISQSRLFDNVPKATNAERDLMQVAATIAMSGFLNGGHSISFGFPRPDRSNFYDALSSALTRIGEGRLKPKEAVNLALGIDSVKDGGIDVISWSHTPRDTLPGGKSIYFSQVASGNNWRAKAVSSDIERIQNHWMERRIPRICDAMCIPFDFEVEGATAEDSAELLTDEFGLILHRCRLPSYFGKGLAEVARTPELYVERTNDVTLISDYVNRIRTQLMSAA
ncbi:hypothetical protein [Photobacterium ganghwense]|uniref:hypothetical protein n=1 Tax=Photobacterium ganghwense TaxID=320778 RepID=UPI001C2D25BF|nr:hypothetical protein [Photobacterium ganghwense]MBV1843384.1 hypothetical protein [Photobacterium ganghwense]